MTNISFFNSYRINNIEIHNFTIKNLEKYISELLKKNSVNLITTFNLDFLRITSIDSEFFDICKKSLINLSDGYGIVYLIKKKYNEKIPRITGSDLFHLLLSISKNFNKKIAIIGASESVSQKTKQILINQYKIPSDDLLFISPQYNFENDTKLNNRIIREVSNFKPDIVFAALGCPRQEKWLYKNMESFGSTINVGIGATLDFFTNTKKRSPLFLQNLGLEWLWRLLHEPRRLFNRYIVKDLPFFLKIYFSKKF